jgi:hypothetical protein
MYLALKVLFNGVFTVLPVWVSKEGVGALMGHRAIYTCTQNRNVLCAFKQRGIIIRHDLKTDRGLLKAGGLDKR